MEGGGHLSSKNTCAITYNNILRKSIRLAQKSYETLFHKFKDGILNKTKRKSNFPRFFKDGEYILYDKSVITNKFNKFYANIGLNLRKYKIAKKQTFPKLSKP